MLVIFSQQKVVMRKCCGAIGVYNGKIDSATRNFILEDVAGFMKNFICNYNIIL